MVTAVTEGAILGGREADKYKSDPKKNEKRIDTFSHVRERRGDAGIAKRV